jgi:hypothetical protein
MSGVKPQAAEGDGDNNNSSGSDGCGFRIIDDDLDPARSPSMRLLRSASERMDCCFSGFSSLSYASRLARFLAAELKDTAATKDVQARVVMPITPESMGTSKMLVRCVGDGLYHSAGLTGSFAIVDGSHYICHVGTASTLQGDVHRLLHSTSPAFVQMQQHLFDSLLERAVPAKDRIRELARGAGGSSEFTMTVTSPRDVLQISQALVSSAAFDLLVLFSTLDSFFEAEERGLLDLLGDASRRGVAAVRVLVKVDDERMKDASKQKIKQKHGRIMVSFIRPPPSSSTTTAARSDMTMLIIADQAYSFAVEAANASKDADGALPPSHHHQQQQPVLATYSNSEPTVLAYCSMFENLWIQAEIERQNSIKQAYFRMFKGQKLRDEVYHRDWKLKDEEGNDAAP